MTLTLLVPTGTSTAGVRSRPVPLAPVTDDCVLRARLVAGDDRALATVVAEFGASCAG